MSAPCRYCERTPGPLDSPEACCEAAADVAALEADAAHVETLRDALTDALDVAFDSAAALEMWAPEALEPIPSEMREYAKTLRAKAEAWRGELNRTEVNQGSTK